jgi:hypothetical protein
MALPARPGRAIGDPRPFRALFPAHPGTAARHVWRCAWRCRLNASGRQTAVLAGAVPGAATD